VYAKVDVLGALTMNWIFGHELARTVVLMESPTSVPGWSKLQIGVVVEAVRVRVT
jgi:hypothetical protein